MAYVGLDTLFHSGVNIVGVIGPRSNHSTYQAFKAFVKARNLNYIEYNTISDDELYKKIYELNVDIGVVCSFNDKIPKRIIDLIKGGILNIHPSPLPKYRGGNPYSRVIMNGDPETAVTLHYLAEEFDTGDIIAQEPCPIEDYETMGTIFNKTNNIGCKMLLKAIIYYEQHNTLPARKQPEGDYIKAPNIKDYEKIIDYNKPAEVIERQVRGLNPYLTATTIFRNQILLIHKVTLSEQANVENFSNGEICKIENNKLYIKTSNGCITPEVLQYAGYFTGDCSDFIKIVKPKIGEKFQNGFT